MSDEERVYKQHIAEYFGGVKAPDFGVDPRLFKAMGHRLVEWAQVPSGGRVLDVAAGRGAILFPAAERVGKRGRVVGIDLAAAMVQATTAEIRERGLRNAEMRQMDAERLQFRGAAFDRVLCGWALFLFPRLDRALSEFYRVLKPGGWLAATTFGERDDRRWRWYEPLLEAHGLSQAGTVRWRTLHLGLWNPLDRPDELKAVFSRAGLLDIQVVEEEFDLRYADEKEVWVQMYSSGDRVLFESLAPDSLQRFRSKLFEKLRGIKQPDGFHQRFWVLFTRGIKPSSPRQN